MKKGYLSQYFNGFAAKRLSNVEVSPSTSNQHEFNGVKQLKNILGEPDGKVRYNTKFIYMNDVDDDTLTNDSFLTWYDAREKHPVRSEYRLYFPSNTVISKASDGDLLLIIKKNDDSLVSLIVKHGTTIERQIQWLFDCEMPDGTEFTVRDNLETDHDKIDYVSKFILSEIGIETEDFDGENYLDTMLKKFNNSFPTTVEFSNYSRSTIPDLTSVDDPDSTIIAWMDREESLFKSLERHFLEQKLKDGFGDDIIDGFLKLSLSVQNRRKSRAGSALENHLEFIFKEHSIYYSRAKITEKNHKPDFIFPSIEKYHDDTYPASKLVMLAAKTSCKERWRQILNEAERITKKHLITLEPGISENSTAEMIHENVQLILPIEVQKTFSIQQREKLLSLSDFIRVLNSIQ